MLTDWLDTGQPVSVTDGLAALRRAYAGDYPIEVAVERAGTVEWRRTRLLRLVEGARPQVVVMAPQAADGAVLLREGTEALVLTNLGERGIGFVSSVSSRGFESDETGQRLAAVVLDLPSSFYGVQRRMFVRVKPPSLLECDVTPAEPRGQPSITGFVHNVSRGGVSIRLNTRIHVLRDLLHAGDPALISIVLGEEEEATTLGATVLRVTEPRDQDQLPLVAFQWRDLSPDNQRALAGFIVGLERRILRKRRELDEGPFVPDGRRDWHVHTLPETQADTET